METNRQTPHSREVEEYLIGSILVENTLVPEVVDRLDTNDFYYPEIKNIFNAIVKLDKHRQEVDLTSVVDELKRNNLLEASGGVNYLIDLMGSIPSVVNVHAYIQVIREKSVERQLLRTMDDISTSILDNKLSFQDVIDLAERKIIEVLNKRQTAELIRIDTATEKVFGIIEANRSLDSDGLTGLDTGFKDLNNITHGFQSGELIVLAARPGIGKSAFALNVAANACEAKDSHVAFFSLEMGIDQLLMRMYASHSGIHLNKIRSGNLTDAEFARLNLAKIKLDKFNIYLDEAGATDVEEVVTIVES